MMEPATNPSWSKDGNFLFVESLKGVKDPFLLAPTPFAFISVDSTRDCLIREFPSCYFKRSYHNSTMFSPYPLPKLSLVLASIALLNAFSMAGESTSSSTPHDTQSLDIPFVSAEDALKSISLPEGFTATLFAAEPDVQQPIAMSWDERGRLWIAENYTYAESQIGFDRSLNDRILIFEDRDNNGHFDSRKVFWDEGKLLTSIAIDHGGIWALCPPELLFIPDADHDDVPDGPPLTVLDGWDDDRIRHNFANGLKWGPDGWLYGRHGILATSNVGPPGATERERTQISAGMWRYHPVTKAFEQYVHGTTNPFGHDWTPEGQLFFINTVIGHLWHGIPRAHYRRMFGEDPNPVVYELMEQTADHVHWDQREKWSDIRKLGVTDTTSAAGGGHAHSGFVIYQGENWPATYRGAALTVNLHGHRINHDVLVREGASYVGRHQSDFGVFADPWFRGVELGTGPDGAVYVLDWSDIGECHENDGVHRSSGRIYKISYGTPKAPKHLHTTHSTDDELLASQYSNNEWLPRQGRRLMMGRARAGVDLSALRRKISAEIVQPSIPIPSGLESLLPLRLLWSLHVSGGVDESLLLKFTKEENEHLRVWAIRLIGESERPSPRLQTALSTLATEETSGLVLLELCSILQGLETETRERLADPILLNPLIGTHPSFQLMLWPALADILTANPYPVMFGDHTTKLREFVARRLTSDMTLHGKILNDLFSIDFKDDKVESYLPFLTGMKTALSGRSKEAPPQSWNGFAARAAQSDSQQLRTLIRELSVIFGDGRALAELRVIALDREAAPMARRNAIRSLAQAQDDAIFEIATQLLESGQQKLAAIQALGTLSHPRVGDVLLSQYPRMEKGLRQVTMEVLATREHWATTLVQSVRTGAIKSTDVTRSVLRQLRNLGDETIRLDVDNLWPITEQMDDSKKSLYQRLESQLTPASLAKADQKAGHNLFMGLCATCHKLRGVGADIGPDLTGSDRKNLNYLLENLIDPSAQIPDSYRLSLVRLTDGQVLSGIVLGKTNRDLRLRTIAETLTLPVNRIMSVEQTTDSWMPSGILEALEESQARDLIGYLQSN